MKLFLILTFLFTSFFSFSQNGWTSCHTPSLDGYRVEDIFMVNSLIGYAAVGNSILKTVDGGDNWFNINSNSDIYCRSIEFLDEQVGFSGSFLRYGNQVKKTLRKTSNGGLTWTPITTILNADYGREGICGLAVADDSTVYGCGNWYQDSAYVVKSTDRGNTWVNIDMKAYAASLIDMYFISKDTGFVSGRSPMPFQTAIILYTTDGGVSWTTKYLGTITHEYCWKIQHFNNNTYFASIEDFTSVNPRILKSTDGGMNWQVQVLDTLQTNYDIEGVGFMDSLHGWAGGEYAYNYSTDDGGITWQRTSELQTFNRFFKVNDTLAFACGHGIWKYDPFSVGLNPIPDKLLPPATISCFPNPVDDILTLKTSVVRPTRLMISLVNSEGKRLEIIDNSEKQIGEFQYKLSTKDIPAGNYTIIMKTHENRQLVKVVIAH